MRGGREFTFAYPFEEGPVNPGLGFRCALDEEGAGGGLERGLNEEEEEEEGRLLRLLEVRFDDELLLVPV